MQNWVQHKQMQEEWYRIAGNFGGRKFWRIGELSPKLDTPKSFYCTKSWSHSAQAAKIKFAKT